MSLRKPFKRGNLHLPGRTFANVTKIAARHYGFDFPYQSKPNWETYASLLAFAETIRRDLRDIRPRDMIDLQSFMWVQGSDEYAK